MSKNTRRFLLWFLVIWAALNLFLRPDTAPVAQEQLIFKTVKQEYSQGDKVELQIENRFPYAVQYVNECPGEPFAVSRTDSGTPLPLTATATNLTCDTAPIVLDAGETQKVEYGQWNQDLFWEIGSYSIVGTFTRADEVAGSGSGATVVGPEPTQPSTYTFTANFTVAKRGWFSTIAMEIFYRPIYNFLVFLMSHVPGRNLGLAIIVLTIVIRLALFVPTLHSLKSQRELQELQPKLQALRVKYKDNQQQLAQETMKLYKEHGVNPFGSCLPLLIQMPFLFAVFFVLQNGLDPSTMYLLYEPLRGMDLSTVGTMLLSFDMTHPVATLYERCVGTLTCFNPKSLVMPILVGGLQGISSWLTIRRNKKRAGAQPVPATPKADAAAVQQKTMNVMMTVLLPLMIAWFSFMYPVGLSLYWAVTTLFSIGQQMYLARRQDATAVIEHQSRTV